MRVVRALPEECLDLLVERRRPREDVGLRARPVQQGEAWRLRPLVARRQHTAPFSPGAIGD